mmetsp:Transcript_1184/g.2586  ORF Transcript_1184/g.2586 Transcript_1184/m.2586 type:complete len:216 (+) Transcript_1184:58-705(+)
MFRSRSTSVRRFSALGTFKYSHDRQAKKNAPIASWLIARSVSVVWRLAISLSTPIGSAFCWIGFGSSFLKARNWRDRSRLSSPSSSRVGFGLSCSRKVDATNEREFRTVLSAREWTFDPENRPSRRAMAKAPNSLFRSLRLNSSRKTSLLIPVDRHHSTHRSHARAWSSCVFPVTAPSRAVSAATRSAKRRFRWAADEFPSSPVPVKGRKILGFE